MTEDLSEIFPIITITDHEDYDFPGWIQTVERNVIGPTGTLKFEILKVLEEGEDPISGREMLHRSRSHEADFGLLHAKAFLEKYEEEGFGLSLGTWIIFPGTVAILQGGSRIMPYLRWDGKSWSLFWFWLGSQSFPFDRFLHLRE